MRRSPKAHLTYTLAERAGQDRIRKEIRESGLPTLLECANTPDWSAWSAAWPKINGDLFTPDTAADCRGVLCAWLDNLIAGTLSFSGIRVTVDYALMHGCLESEGPQQDLGQYLDWLLCEAIRTGEARRIRKCPACGLFHTRKSRFCSRRHGDRYRKETPARRRTYKREYEARTRGRSREQELASPKVPTI
jgi:hypothetical protein